MLFRFMIISYSTYTSQGFCSVLYFLDIYFKGIFFKESIKNDCA